MSWHACLSWHLLVSPFRLFWVVSWLRSVMDAQIGIPVHRPFNIDIKWRMNGANKPRSFIIERCAWVWISHMKKSNVPWNYDVMTNIVLRVPTDQGIQGKFWRLFPVREIREKQGFFSQNQGKKFQIRELFFQTIFKPFKPINLRKMFFKTVKPQELSGNCNICID